MEPELKQQLQRTSKKHLLQLLQELALRHPTVLPEITEFLENLLVLSQKDYNEGEVSEDWDFSGDDSTVRPFPQPSLSSPESEEYRQRITELATRLSQAGSPKALAEDLGELLEEAEERVEQHDHDGALHLYSLMLDERLNEPAPEFVPIFDEALHLAIPKMEVLLSEVTENEKFDVSSASISPLLTANVRHHWLTRLFSLWLKRLDIYNIEEDLPRVMLYLARNEDLSLLRSLVQAELQKQAPGEHSNIVDFARQYRTRALEKFLKELPSI